jgi:hypothetical protein
LRNKRVVLPRVRGSVLNNGIAFVERTYGPAAHETVLKALPPDVAAAFKHRIGPGHWRPASHGVAYMETAQALLAPKDQAFYERMGLFSGVAHRETHVALMLHDRQKITPMLRKLWQGYCDQGEAIVVDADEATLRFRLVGIKVTPSFCQRILGSAMAHFHGHGATHTACVFRGAEACEFSISWGEE